MAMSSRGCWSLAVALWAAIVAQAEPLRLTAHGSHDLTLSEGQAGEWAIRTTGRDPYLVVPTQSPLPPVLAFEYTSPTGTDNVQMFLGPPYREPLSRTAPGLNKTERWTPFAYDLTSLIAQAGVKTATLRLDLGTKPDCTIRLRNVELRPRTSDESRRAADAERVQMRERALRSYLTQEFPAVVDRVSVNDQTITVDGRTTQLTGPLVLAELPLHADITAPIVFTSSESICPDTTGRFRLTVNRFAAGRDRSSVRWAVTRSTGQELLSRGRFADQIAVVAPPVPEKPRSKKGLGAFGTDRPVSDLDDLNIAAVTVNVVLNGLFRSGPGKGVTAFAADGRTWYYDTTAVGRLDRTLLEAANHRLVVSAIILIAPPKNAAAGSWPRLAAHPDAEPGCVFAVPNVVEPDGLAAYAAGLAFLAQRYSRADGSRGRIHHWIMHNEVDQAKHWTNAGDKTALQYTELLHRSLRLAHLTLRRYDPNATVFVSLTHHWKAGAGNGNYAGRELLENLLALSHAEGDFDWGIAYHPYPANLRTPRVWEDRETTYTFDTPKITFRNLEVLDAWVRQPKVMVHGERMRLVHLTEQGFNSVDYGETALRDQAAALAFAWNKLQACEAIQVMHYHNWIDNRGEDGLRLGLRKFPDQVGDPLGRKPIWDVYRALGTAEEVTATSFALPVIKVTDWSEVRRKAEVRLSGR